MTVPISLPRPLRECHSAAPARFESRRVNAPLTAKGVAYFKSELLQQKRSEHDGVAFRVSRSGGSRRSRFGPSDRYAADPFARAHRPLSAAPRAHSGG